jgi:hypothetical protein
MVVPYQDSYLCRVVLSRKEVGKGAGNTTVVIGTQPRGNAMDENKEEDIRTGLRAIAVCLRGVAKQLEDENTSTAGLGTLDDDLRWYAKLVGQYRSDLRVLQAK